MACTDCNPSSANWNQCFTVVNNPTDVIAGFNTVLSQICTIKTIADNAAILPTFNNIGSCLASPSSTDSLVATVDKLRTRVCQSPTYSANNINWQCVSIPGNPSSVEIGLQNIVNRVSTISRTIPTMWSGDFVVTLTDSGNPCAGYTIALATPINVDRFVAATSTDDAPGVLQDKLVAGTNLTLDFTDPTQVTINATGGNGDRKVKADTADPSPGYLDEKITSPSGSNGVTIAVGYNSGTHNLEILPTLDFSAFIPAFISYLNSNDDVRATFCTLIQSCPSACSAPSSVQAVIVS